VGEEGEVYLVLRAFAAIREANVYVFMIILDAGIGHAPAHNGHFLFIDFYFMRGAGSWPIKTCYIHLSPGV
jgi:hypothetical protein